MRRFRAANDRGQTHARGVDSRHAFSSGGFHDPAWTGLGALRVLSTHCLEAGAMIEHARANMEVLCYVVSGSVVCAGAATAGSAADDGGHRGLAAGGLLWIGAGHGSGDTAATRAETTAQLVQAWIQPDRVNATPGVAHRAFVAAERRGRWAVLASPDGAGGALPLRQQAWLRAIRLAEGETGELALDARRRYWLQVVSGSVQVDARPMAAGDGLAIESERGKLHVQGRGDDVAEVFVFDLPGIVEAPAVGAR